MNSSNTYRRLIIGYCSFFFLILLIPTVYKLTTKKAVSNCEKRTILTFPKFNYQDTYLQECGNYFEENYGLRNELIYYQSKIKLSLFNSSANPDQVVFGKNGWFFYSSKSDLSYGSYSRTNLLNDIQLNDFKSLHEKRKEELAKRNIQYVTAVWPNKNTIYSEQQPLQMQIQIEDTVSKIDQVLAFLNKSKSTVRLIDVRKQLLKKKAQRLYLKHDTHWNNLGGYYAYHQFLNKTKSIFKVTPYSLSQFIIKQKKIIGGDLYNILGICDRKEYFEWAPILKLKNKTTISEDTDFKDSYGKYNKTAPSKLRVLFFRDSYMDAMMYYFSLHFQHSYYYRSEYDQKIVDLIKPDVVVVCKVERYL